MDKIPRWHLPLIGLMQGIVLASLYYGFNLREAVPLWVRLLVDLAALVPVLYYATDSIPGLKVKPRAWIIAALTVTAIALHEYNVWVFKDTNPHPSWAPEHIAPILIFTFIAVHLLVHSKRLNPTNHGYRDLFNSSWRNAILCGFAVALTGVFWLILMAGGELFRLIKIDALRNLIEKPWFNIPATAGVFSVVIAVALMWHAMIENMRRLLLGLLKWFLPLVLALAAVWVVCLPFTGLRDLFSNRSAAWIMLPGVAAAVLFANAAFQDGDEASPYHRPLSGVLSWLWIASVPIALIALWAFWLRVSEYSWTAERIWGVFVTIIAILYAVGYSLSIWRRKGGNANSWMPTIAQTNRIAAVAVCAGIFLLLGPLLDGRRIEAGVQADRVLAMKEAPKAKFPARAWIGAEVDVNFVHENGRFGIAALEKLAAPTAQYQSAEVKKVVGPLLKTQRDVIATQKKYRYWLQKVPDPIRIEEINPAERNAVLFEQIKKSFNSRTDEMKLSMNCSGFEKQVCNLWWVDLNGDGEREAVSFSGPYADGGMVYSLKDDKAVTVGRFEADGNNLARDVLQRAVRADAVELVPNEWKRIKVGDRVYDIR